MEGRCVAHRRPERQTRDECLGGGCGLAAGGPRRVQSAYDPQLFQEAGGRLIDLLQERLRRMQSSQDCVLNWQEPVVNIEAARQLLNAALPAASREDRLAAFSDRVGQMLDRGQNLHDPRYIGHQVPAPMPLAGLFDAVGSVTNQVMAIYEMGPWATAVEKGGSGTLGQLIGWSRDRLPAWPRTAVRWPI